MKEREAVYETSRHLPASPLAGRFYCVSERMRVIIRSRCSCSVVTCCSKRPGLANIGRPGVAIANDQTAQARLPYSWLLSGYARVHGRAIWRECSLAAGSAGFCWDCRLPCLLGRGSIWNVSSAPFQGRFYPGRPVHQDALGVIDNPQAATAFLIDGTYLARPIRRTTTLATRCLAPAYQQVPTCIPTPLTCRLPAQAAGACWSPPVMPALRLQCGLLPKERGIGFCQD